MNKAAEKKPRHWDYAQHQRSHDGHTTPWIPFDQVPRFIRALERHTRGTHSEKQIALELLVGLCGLRAEETKRLTPFDVQPGTTLYVPTAKRGNPRQLALPTWIHSQLTSLAKERRIEKTSTLFTGHKRHPLTCSNLSATCFNWTTRILGSGFRYHSLRKTCAMWSYRETRDLRLIQRILGHRYIGSTVHYVESTIIETDVLPVATFNAPPHNAASREPTIDGLHPAVIPLRDRTSETPTCSECGQAFTPQRKTQRFCSKSCSSRRKMKLRHQRRIDEKTRKK